jgi:hypothetical protein
LSQSVISKWTPAVEYKVLNEARIRKIDAMAWWVIGFGEGQVILGVRDGKYRFVQPRPVRHKDRAYHEILWVWEPVDKLRVLTPDISRSIDDFLAWLIQLGNGEVVLDIENSELHAVTPCPSLNAV